MTDKATFIDKIIGEKDPLITPEEERSEFANNLNNTNPPPNNPEASLPTETTNIELPLDNDQNLLSPPAPTQPGKYRGFLIFLISFVILAIVLVAFFFFTNQSVGQSLK